jgi:hypothetical protein
MEEKSFWGGKYYFLDIIFFWKLGGHMNIFIYFLFERP